MNTVLYVIVIYFISATTGEYQGELKSEKPMTLQECTKTLIERGPVNVVDGVAQVGACTKYDNGHVDT